MYRTTVAGMGLVATLIIPLLAVGACQTEPEATEPVVELSPEYAGLDPGAAVIEILDEAIASEIMAHFTYLEAARDFGRPFTRVQDAELRHFEAVGHLYEKRGLEPPPYLEPEEVPTFETRLLACQAGASAERAVVELYDRLIPLAPADVAAVFLRLQEVSEDNHLQAFLACS